MVDETLILRKLAAIDQYFEQISEYRNVAIEQYKGDWKLQRIVERTLQMMVESCVDIAGHIIADSKFKIPDSYADTFRVLSDNNIISKDLCRTMIQISKFRNIIVHNYDQVDAEIVVGILGKRLDDFKTYKKAIITWLRP